MSAFVKIPEELLKPSYLLMEPVHYTLAEILRLCRRPMVLPGPLVRSMLQDLLGAIALCHDRNIVIKTLDAEKVRCGAVRCDTMRRTMKIGRYLFIVYCEVMYVLRSTCTKSHCAIYCYHTLEKDKAWPVSYTHLTLPTICSV